MDDQDQTPTEQYSAEAEQQPDPNTVAWTASEFIYHEKSGGWYMVLALAAVVVAALAYLLTREKIAVAVIIFATGVFAFYASRKPRQLEYQLDSRGITIGQKFFPYHEFKSYAVVPERAFSSLLLMPHKRFGVSISIIYPPEEEAAIEKLFSQELPLEDHTHDPIDRLLRSIRF